MSKHNMPKRPSRFNRRSFLKTSGVGATAFTLAGCQSIMNDGNGGNTSLSDDDPIKIGAIVPEPDGLGETVLNSAYVAEKVLNEQDGINGRKVEVLHGDSTGGAAAARREYERLVTEENVHLTVGGFEVDALMKSIAEHQKIHITTMGASELPARLVSKEVSPLGGDPEEEYEKYKYHFRAGPMNTQEMLEAFYEFLQLYGKDFGWETISILAENLSDDVEEEVEEVTQKLREQGFEVPISQAISTGISDFTPLYDDVESAGTDLCATVSLLTGIPMVRQWADQEREFDMGGAIIWAMFPWFWEETGGAAEGLITGNAMTPQTENTEHTQKFLDRYQDEYGEGAAPIFAGPITYDTIRGVKYIYEEAGTMDEEELIPWLEEEYHWQGSSLVHDHAFRGPNEEYAHDFVWDCMEACEGEFDNGSPEGPTGVPVWQQWQAAEDGDGGVMEAIAPSYYKTADYVSPPWMR